MAVQKLAERQSRAGYVVARGLIESGSNAAVNHLRATRIVYERLMPSDRDVRRELLGVAKFALDSLDVAWIELAMAHAADIPKEDLDSLTRLRSVIVSFRQTLEVALDTYRRQNSPDLESVFKLAKQGEGLALDLWRSAFASSEEKHTLPEPSWEADTVAEAWIRGIDNR